jgi:3-(3-hydroxy-phenyl)propionate hydroxylase
MAAFDPRTRAFFDALGTTVVSLDHIAADSAGQLLTRLLDDAKANAVLVRPDRVIAASGDRADLREWQRLLVAAGIDPAPALA